MKNYKPEKIIPCKKGHIVITDDRGNQDSGSENLV